MKTNYRPDRIAFLDFETQSECNLKQSTARKYAAHPSTRALTCVVKFGDTVVKMGPGQVDKELLQRVAETHTMCAHNASFDAAIWELTLGLPPATWCDTMPKARAAGYPGKLDDIGMSMFGEGKDKNGKRLIDMLCILKPGQKPPAVGPAHDLLLQYNVRDVELLEMIYERVKNFGEPEVMDVDAKINERGIPVNREFLLRVNELYAENAEFSKAEFEAETDGVSAGSSKQVKEYLLSKGFSFDGVNKVVMRAFFNDPESFFVGEGEMGEALGTVQDILALRSEIVGVGWGKVKAALNAIDDDNRLRDQFVYYAAGPGRWAGRQLQPHNMPSIIARGVDLRNVKLEYDAVKAAAAEMSKVLNRRVPAADVLSGMLRHMVQADNFVIADYAAVEARCLAWMAHEDKMLKLFGDPKRSVYVDMGEKIYRRTIDKKQDQQEYTLSKSVVLGCGYGMSGAKFEYTLVSRGETAALSTLNEAGILIADLVKLYRSTYPAVPALWKQVDNAAKSAVTGSPSRAGRCDFKMVDKDLHIVLPSGRPIVYRDARIEMVVPAYCKMYNMPEIPVPTVTYATPRSMVKRGFLYGPKTVENMCQGCCRDLLAAALVKCEKDGLHPVLHVHDEGCCEDPPDAFEHFMQIMSTPPEWAEGFPVLAEGYSGAIWTKSPRGYKELAAMNGAIL